jgi:hypothetical protein
MSDDGPTSYVTGERLAGPQAPSIVAAMACSLIPQIQRLESELGGVLRPSDIVLDADGRPQVQPRRDGHEAGGASNVGIYRDLADWLESLATGAPLSAPRPERCPPDLARVLTPLRSGPPTPADIQALRQLAGDLPDLHLLLAHRNPSTPSKVRQRPPVIGDVRTTKSANVPSRAVPPALPTQAISKNTLDTLSRRERSRLAASWRISAQDLDRVASEYNMIPVPARLDLPGASDIRRSPLGLVALTGALMTGGALTGASWFLWFAISAPLALLSLLVAATLLASSAATAALSVRLFLNRITAARALRRLIALSSTSHARSEPERLAVELREAIHNADLPEVAESDFVAMIDTFEETFSPHVPAGSIPQENQLDWTDALKALLEQLTQVREAPTDSSTTEQALKRANLAIDALRRSRASAQKVST